MEAEGPSEIFISRYQSTRHHMLEDWNLEAVPFWDNIYAILCHILEEPIHFVKAVTFNRDVCDRTQRSLEALVNIYQTKEHNIPVNLNYQNTLLINIAVHQTGNC
jgi:hypothetical protein